MVEREWWLNQIESLLKEKSILWLSGVRRVGKTILCRQVPGAECFNCDLPSIQRQLADPEFFLRSRGPNDRIVLDEVQRLADPSLLLKIAADEFPTLEIIATGSSTLYATRKFRDSLSGRKRSLRLVPVPWSECLIFGVRDLDQRLLRGGFPEMLLAGSALESFFAEWVDSLYARDIQELFGVRNRVGFLTLLGLLARRSAGQLDVTGLSRDVGLSRPTVLSHLEALEVAHVISLVPPWHSGGSQELVRRPKVYCFDTGFVAHARGWGEIRDTDRGQLWEHLVLDELRNRIPLVPIRYWRDKKGHEVDFVVDRGSAFGVDTVEAKIEPDAFDAGNLAVFRAHYPNGRNLLVCPCVPAPYMIRKGGIEVTVCGVEELKP
jgi:hypothetical protein